MPASGPKEMVHPCPTNPVQPPLSNPPLSNPPCPIHPCATISSVAAPAPAGADHYRRAVRHAESRPGRAAIHSAAPASGSSSCFDRDGERASAE